MARMEAVCVISESLTYSKMKEVLDKRWVQRYAEGKWKTFCYTGWLWDIGYIWIINVSNAQVSMTSYFLLHQHVTKNDSIQCLWCSIWPPDFRISPCNGFYRFIQTLLATSWQTVLISNIIVLVAISYGQVFNISDPSQICRWKLPVELQRVRLLASSMDHILQSMNLETFHTS